MKILVIDDEPLIRRSLKKAFEIQGDEVFLAENGKLGIDVWLREKPDLIFLDVIMPELTGPEVLREMANKKSGKVILMSAFSGEQNVETARKMGADDFFEKPFPDIFDLVKKAKELCA